MDLINDFMGAFASFMWGPPLLILLLGGGLYFSIYSRFIPFKYFRHGVDILFGRYNDPNDPGEITHFQALSSALASTVGLGNISGVAIAIQMGGPGALFWMWVSAVVGMSTKFFSCTLSILFRGKDDQGNIQGGPMYYIENGLGKKFKPLSILFSIAGLFGCTVIFQSNQLADIIRNQVLTPNGWFIESIETGNLIQGLIMAFITSLVIFGGIKRIGQVATYMVPVMVVLYMFAGLLVVFNHLAEIPSIFGLIIHDAFTGDAVMGGAVGSVIIAGVRRALFSNEAGLGTSDMAHGAAMTKEPVREGLVAMIEPFIDTIVVCTITAIVILASGVWEQEGLNGVTLTTTAFVKELGGFGFWLLLTAVLTFSLSTMMSYSYYGSKCSGYLFGTKSIFYYRCFYVFTIVVGAMISIEVVINFIDGMYAIMAIPTIIGSVMLSPKVMVEARRYFANLN
ncbi:MAG: alanine/glycine:cation symporter family protein [Candidatus Marinimicrobia bacterium]|jgi:AGCS family alanine or glycine:cation symporter|nr:alanine/glycine:cation symporter family protein [Candidatus Neomarinimicrobiota bacterium]MDP6200892.1 alanine/glycine:cation symporter family protein [Candidatus Neomarinimicrobiota bacterium]MDP6628065.1 alanine/glycine:cation symporter family protein [Candidatus Neomarinimicrobiota bacterium]MDP6754946.1 alanine/glycine:cation symporter family protein [Candidatus Neomarinimicrobiota bacterium]MDP7330071.1 alanine/glycine:cation symporter family protein [Candidatus Neomarinimicrobiota bact|tara:strand:+ start:286 stop:1644 length:1359 start_codon:yes stop_codon:yes gene_type:complete